MLLEQSAEALHKSLGAEVKTKEVITVGGMRGFSLVVSGPGTGAGIDGKGTVRTTQHWVAVPRDKDVVIFLMTTPDDKFAANEAGLPDHARLAEDHRHPDAGPAGRQVGTAPSPGRCPGFRKPVPWPFPSRIC